ncbi:hypothetical protein EB093_06025 [bacterium]|nr:hypothetical protein [bacterium]
MSKTFDPKEVLAAVENLAAKRHVISDEALRAKDERDSVRRPVDDSRQAEVDKRWDKKLAIIEEFNDSVTLLMSIFQNSQFDELAVFASSPVRVLGINFLIGILRGVGFAIGFLLMLLVAAVAIKHSLPPGFLNHVLGVLIHHIT